MKRTRILSIGAVVASMIALSACVPTGVGDQTAGERDDSTDPDRFKGQTLVVWDTDTHAATLDILDAEFEEKWGVTVDRVVFNYAELETRAKLALAESDGPDVVTINQGIGPMGPLVAGNLIYDLTEFANERNWYEDFGDGLLARQSMTPDGKQMGTGNLYGMGPYQEPLGWFYNRDKLASAGIEVPTTLAELNDALAALKAGGEEYPIWQGQGVAGRQFEMLQRIEWDPADVDAWTYHLSEGLTIDTPDSVDGAQQLLDWSQEYMNPEFAGIGYDDWWQQFAAGSGTFIFDGTWLAGGFDGDAVGFFPMPGNDAETLPAQINTASGSFAVRNTTEVLDLALEYLDWNVSARAAVVNAEANFLPLRIDAVDAEGGSPLFQELAAGLNRIVADNRSSTYLDDATPDLYMVINEKGDALLAGDISPSEYVKAIQAEYEKFYNK